VVKAASQGSPTNRAIKQFFALPQPHIVSLSRTSFTRRMCCSCWSCWRRLSISRLLTTLDMMGRDSQRLLLLAAGLISLAGADTVPSCWVCENIFVNKAVLTRRQDSCITKAVEANPACYDSYGTGIQATSCYCGPDQGGYATNVECCANELCAATDFSTGRIIARSICSSSVLPHHIPHLLTILQTRTTRPN
jgi:hypothetical protein